ncbi:F420-dependent methylenetetrahydromethanopterin dehydrogenase [Methanopyrus sp.]
MAAAKAIFIKCGNLGTSMMMNMLLDERADRENVEFRVVGTPVKMDPKCVEAAVETALDVTSSRTSQCTTARIRRTRVPLKLGRYWRTPSTPQLSSATLRASGTGWKSKDSVIILVKPDAMLGARRKFLDPIEMVVYNADLVKVLATTGVFRTVEEAFDELIEKAKEGKIFEGNPPRLVIDKNMLLEREEFENPYVMVKAIAALEIAENVTDVSAEECFIEQDKERYIPIVASAYEMVRKAAELADEARELEKSADAVLRTPHVPDGKVLSERKLMEYPG